MRCHVYIIPSHHLDVTVDHEGGHRRPRALHKTHNTAAVAITLPETEAEERLEYLDQYSCQPPPLMLIALSLSQIGVFIYEAVLLAEEGKTMGPNSPVYIQVKYAYHLKS